MDSTSSASPKSTSPSSFSEACALLNVSFESTDSDHRYNHQFDKMRSYENDLYDECEEEVLEEETLEAMTEMFSFNECTLFDEILAATQDKKSKAQQRLNSSNDEANKTVSQFSIKIAKVESDLKSIDFLKLDEKLNEAEDFLHEIDNMRVILKESDGRTSPHEFEDAAPSAPFFECFLSTSEYYYLTSPEMIVPQTQFSTNIIHPTLFEENELSHHLFNRQSLCSIEELDETLDEEVSINWSSMIDVPTKDQQVEIKLYRYSAHRGSNTKDWKQLQVSSSNLETVEEVAFEHEIGNEELYNLESGITKDSKTLRLSTLTSNKKDEHHEEHQNFIKIDLSSDTILLDKNSIELNLERETTPRLQPQLHNSSTPQLPDVVTASFSENDDHHQIVELSVETSNNINHGVEKVFKINSYKADLQDANRNEAELSQETIVESSKYTNLKADTSILTSDTTLYASALNDTAMLQSEIENSYGDNDNDEEILTENSKDEMFRSYTENSKSPTIVCFKDANQVKEFLKSSEHTFEVFDSYGQHTPSKSIENKSVQVTPECIHGNIKFSKGIQSSPNTSSHGTQSPSEAIYCQKSSKDLNQFTTYRTNAHYGLNVPKGMPNLVHFNQVKGSNLFLCCNKPSNKTQKSNDHISDFDHHPSTITCCHCTQSHLNKKAVQFNSEREGMNRVKRKLSYEKNVEPYLNKATR